MPAWLCRLLSIVGWFYLVVGAVSLLGDILRPGDASTPELGAMGGYPLDAVLVGVGVALLVIRNRFRARKEE